MNTNGVNEAFEILLEEIEAVTSAVHDYPKTSFPPYLLG